MMTDFLNDIKMLEKADFVSIRRYKRHDKVKLEFKPPSKIKNIVWRLKCHVEDIPDSEKQFREKILERTTNQD